MTKGDCQFCNLEDEIFHQSEHFYAIYNVAPILPGHSLIVPKRHAEDLFELTDEEICEAMTFARDTVVVLMKVFNASGFNLTIQNGEDAGQTVSHVHIHLIPRTPKDLPDPGDWYPRLKESEEQAIDSERRPKLSLNEMKQIVARLRKAFEELT